MCGSLSQQEKLLVPASLLSFGFSLSLRCYFFLSRCYYMGFERRARVSRDSRLGHHASERKKIFEVDRARFVRCLGIYIHTHAPCAAREFHHSLLSLSFHRLSILSIFVKYSSRFEKKSESVKNRLKDFLINFYEIHKNKIYFTLCVLSESELAI